MADSALAALSASAGVAAADLFYADTGAADVKVTGTQLRTYMVGGTAVPGATVTASAPLINLTQTWNSGAVTFTGALYNFTPTASAALSKVVEWQVGGTAVAGIVKDGAMFSTLGLWSSAATSYNGANYYGMGFVSSGIDFYAPGFSAANSAARIGASSTNALNLGGSLGFAPSTASTTADLFLVRTAAATLQHGAANVASGAVAQTLTFQGNTGASTTGPLALVKGALGGSGAGSVGGEVRIQGGVCGAVDGSGGAVSFYGGGVLGAGTTPILGFKVAGDGAVEFVERTAPAAGAANTARLYAEDSGGGKTRLMVIFPSGAAQQVAIEP